MREKNPETAVRHRASTWLASRLFSLRPTKPSVHLEGFTKKTSGDGLLKIDALPLDPGNMRGTFKCPARTFVTWQFRPNIALLVLLTATFFLGVRMLSASGPFIEEWPLIAMGRLFVNPYVESTTVRLTDEGLVLSTVSEEGKIRVDEIAPPFEEMKGSRFYFEMDQEDHLYAQSSDGKLAVSIDRGETWESIPRPAGESVARQSPFAVAVGEEVRLLLGGANGVAVGTIEYDSDGTLGVSWKNQFEGKSVTALSVSLDQTRVAIGSEDGEIIVVDDSEVENWLSRAVSSQVSDSAISSVAFDPSGEDHLLSTVLPSDNLEGPLFSSEDGGRNWDNASGIGDARLPNLPVLAISFNLRDDAEERRVGVVNETGLWESVNLRDWHLAESIASDDEGLLLKRISAAKATPAATVKCSFTVSPLSVDIAGDGATSKIRVNANSSTCAWSVARPASGSPLSIVKGASGRGDGEVEVAMAHNSTAKARTAYLTVAGKRITFKQALPTGRPCDPSIPPDSLNRTIGFEKQTLNLNVTAASNCSWSFSATPSGVSFAPAKGSGTKTVKVSVTANSAPIDRAFSINFAGRQYRLTQRARNSSGDGGGGGSTASCTISASPVDFSFAGGSGTVTVKKTAACGSIKLSSSVSWLKLAQTQVSANGESSVKFSVTESSIARAGVIKATATGLNTTSISINQSAPTAPRCTGVRVSAPGTSVPSSGGALQLTIHGTGDCPVSTVRSDQAWARVTNISNTSATIQIDANTSTSARRATVTVTNSASTVSAGSVTFEQSGSTPVPQPCSIVLDKNSVDFGKTSGESSIGVSPNRSDCTWQVGTVSTSSVPRTWVRVSPASGKGNGTIRIAVDAPGLQDRIAEFVVTSGDSRTTVKVYQGGTFSSNGCQCQGPACGSNIALGLSVGSFNAAGGTTALSVHAPNSCRWTISATDSSWITFLDPSNGAGNGTIRIRVEPNKTGASRTTILRSPEANVGTNGSKPSVTITQGR